MTENYRVTKRFMEVDFLKLLKRKLSDKIPHMVVGTSFPC